MTFDELTMSLLLLRQDSPVFAPEELARLQDAHMAHLADLHDAGSLLANGPLVGPDDRELRGLSIFRTGVEETDRLKAEDPYVVAGRFKVVTLPWLVPSGAMSFSHTRMPRSIADLDT